MTRVSQTRGFPFLVVYTKAVRADVLNFLSGNPIRSGQVRLSGKEQLPTCLGPLREIILDGSPICRRLVLTVLFSTRALKTETQPDLSTIVEPLSKGSSLSLEDRSAEFWRELGYFHSGVIPRPLTYRRFHFSTKSGPNGHALST
jgi:hypothetical protein